MPKRLTTTTEEELPDNIKPFVANGLELVRGVSYQWNGECPWCGKPRFYVSEETSKWDCKPCSVSGNSSTFLQMLWERASWGDSAALAKERGLLSPETVRSWGLKKHPVTENWCAPGYNASGAVVQLYQWVRTSKRSYMMPTAGIGHAMFGVPLAGTEGTLSVCEGVWDGMALWEVLRYADPSDCAVAALPSSSAFKENWAPLFAGRDVVFFDHNDHAIKEGGRNVPSAGYEGVKRAAGVLANATEAPESVSFVLWGSAGFDPKLPSGYDVRDVMREGGDDPAKRLERFEKVMRSKVVVAPEEWLAKTRKHAPTLPPIPCSSWTELENAWKKYLKWRTEMSDVLSVMLAVACSTVQQGDQLFLQVVGDPSSGKTSFCDALLVSRTCYLLEHLTGFHSGARNDKGDDFSLISRINGKTLITPEGDVITANPRFPEIMAQQRRIFDGTSKATYKNRKEDMHYTGLRTPWIMAGTWEMIKGDQSRLGDRFLRVCTHQPAEEVQDAILRKAAYTALSDVLRESNCDPGASMSVEQARAWGLTGGYVNHLRANAGSLLGAVDPDAARTVPVIEAYAKFVSFMRAKTDLRKDSEEGGGKEMPVRLTKQLVRLAVCLAAVLGKRKIDGEVLRRVRKVALDTSRGITLAVAERMYASGRNRGVAVNALANWTGYGDDKVRKILRFMLKIGCAEHFEPVGKSGIRQLVRWRLTERVTELYEAVAGNGE